MTDTISLTEAAKRLSMSWERTWRALLSGNLEGEKRRGRWYVTIRSVRRFERCLRNPTPSSGAASDDR